MDLIRRDTILPIEEATKYTYVPLLLSEPSKEPIVKQRDISDESSSSSSDDESMYSSSSKKTNPQKSKSKEKNIGHGTFTKITEHVIASKTVALERIQPMVAPKLEQAKLLQNSLKTEFIERFEERFPNFKWYVRWVVRDINEHLRDMILDLEKRSKLIGAWLSAHAPDRVINFFEPIPKDEREPVQIPRTNPLSACFLGINVIIFSIGLFIFVVVFAAILDIDVLKSLLRLVPNTRYATANTAITVRNSGLSLLVGSLLAMGLGYLGGMGCLLSQRLMLKSYAVLISLALAGQLLTVVFTFIARKSIEENARSDVKQKMRELYDGTGNSSRVFSHMVDTVQIFFACCGVDSWRDFNNTPWYRKINGLESLANDPVIPDPLVSLATSNPNKIFDRRPQTRKARSGRQASRNPLILFPISCCRVNNELTGVVEGGDLNLQNSRCQSLPPGNENPNTSTSCLSAVKAWMLSQIFVFLGLGFTLAGLEVSAISNALDIIKSIEKDITRRKRAKMKTEHKRDADLWPDLF